jgi:hypothetical protein
MFERVIFHANIIELCGHDIPFNNYHSLSLVIDSNTQITITFPIDDTMTNVQMIDMITDMFGTEIKKHISDKHIVMKLHNGKVIINANAPVHITEYSDTWYCLGFDKTCEPKKVDDTYTIEGIHEFTNFHIIDYVKLYVKINDLEEVLFATIVKNEINSSMLELEQSITIESMTVTFKNYLLEDSYINQRNYILNFKISSSDRSELIQQTLL